MVKKGDPFTTVEMKHLVSCAEHHMGAILQMLQNKKVLAFYMQSVCQSLKEHQAQWWVLQESNPCLFST